jgi:hypothetical protein
MHTMECEPGMCAYPSAALVHACVPAILALQECARMMPQGLNPQEQIDFAVAHLFKTWGLKVAAVSGRSPNSTK